MLLHKILDFALGDITSAPLAPAISTLAVILFFGTVVDVLNATDKKEALVKSLKKIFAYFIFLVVAHRIDVLAVDRLFDWKGSTEYLVILGLAVREGKPLLIRIGAWAGVLPPELLTKRLDQMEQGKVSDSYIDSRELELKIQNLRENLDKLREYHRLKKEAEDLGISLTDSSASYDMLVPDANTGPTGPTL